MPQLRAGSPVLTDRGERVARRWVWWLRPVIRFAVRVIRPVHRWVRRAVQPLLRVVRPRVAPLTEAISRAVEEGSVPAAGRSTLSSVDAAAAGAGGGRGDVSRLAATLHAPDHVREYRPGGDARSRPELSADPSLARH